MQWMEEKLKVGNGQSEDSEARLFQRCQELQAAMQEKDDIIARLEQQLEEQVEGIQGIFITAADVLPLILTLFRKHPHAATVQHAKVPAQLSAQY